MLAHLAKRTAPHIVISDETDKLLESGGGIVKALPLLGPEPFFVLNADTFWMEDGAPNLSGLALAWDGARMDILLMLAEMDRATGHSGRSDFLLGTDGRLTRSGGDPAGLIYAGAAIVHPRIFAGAEAEPHSLNRYFDLTAAEGRLFGWRMRGRWITVGTPEAIPAAEAAVAAAMPS
jgi:MurNAc alpha-1-phosphate uridylyltransferase